jgi:hypothetical protein
VEIEILVIHVTYKGAALYRNYAHSLKKWSGVYCKELNVQGPVRTGEEEARMKPSRMLLSLLLPSSGVNVGKVTRNILLLLLILAGTDTPFG